MRPVAGVKGLQRRSCGQYRQRAGQRAGGSAQVRVCEHHGTVICAAGRVRMGLAHLQAAQRAQVLSRWPLQAGIAAEHASTARFAQTDWPAIVGCCE